MKRLLLVLLFISPYCYAQTHTEVTVEDNQTITGNKTFSGAMNANGGGTLAGTFSGTRTNTGSITDSGTLTVTGTLNCKTFEDQVCVDSANTQGWSGSEFAAWVNSAIASLPLINDPISGNNYPSGIVWLATVGVINQTVVVTAHSPFITIIGPGHTSLAFNCTINGDCWRVNTSPFTTVPASQLQGFSILGSSAANGVGLHIGDGIKFKLRDMHISGFTGANGVGLLVDNATNYTEQFDAETLTIYNNTTQLKFTNSVNTPLGTSMGYQHWRNVILQSNPNQQGVWLSSTGAAIAASPTGATESGTTVTITMSATCSFTTGTSVKILGVGVAGYNGTWTVLTPGCNGGSTFTYTNTASGLAASGGGIVTTNPIILYHANIAWNIENNSGSGPTNYLRVDSGSTMQDNLYDIAIEDQANVGGVSYNFGNYAVISGRGLIHATCGTHTDTLGTGIDIDVPSITFCSPNVSTRTWTMTTGNHTFALYNPIPATSTTTFPAPCTQWIGSYWTGSASAQDQWQLCHTIGTGANGNVGLAFSHAAGSSGAAFVQVPALLVPNGGNSALINFTGSSFPTFSFAGSVGGNVAIAQQVLNFDAVYGTYRVTTDQTITAGASLTAIPGLSWTMPANTALNVKFTCDLLYSQATAAASDSFGIQDVTVAPTNIEAKEVAYTSATVLSAANIPTLTTTTATAFTAFTPSAATTVFNATIDGMIEQPSNAATSVVQIMAQFTTNNGTIKRGSSCQVF